MKVFVAIFLIFFYVNVYCKPTITEEEVIIEELLENNKTELVGWLKIFEHYSNHSSHCHFRNHPELHLAPGKSATISGECMLVTCIDPSMNTLQASWCPSLFPNKNCKIKRGDKSLNYPICCPTLQCVDV